MSTATEQRELRARFYDLNDKLARALGERDALTQENERLANITRIQQKQIERLMDERDAVKQQNLRLREAIEPLLAEVKNLHDTLSASSLELDLQVADGWHALIKPVEAALEGKEGKP